MSTPARELEIALFRTVSERTGYPPEMLDLDLNIELDLGIDSVTRVEILGQFQNSFSDAESRALGAAAEALFAARTLREFVAIAQGALDNRAVVVEDHAASADEVELVRKATEVLGPDHAGRWMRSRIPSLGNETPYALLQSEEGRKQVERVLLKIEHGVY